MQKLVNIAEWINTHEGISACVSNGSVLVLSEDANGRQLADRTTTWAGARAILGY